MQYPILNIYLHLCVHACCVCAHAPVHVRVSQVPACVSQDIVGASSSLAEPCRDEGRDTTQSDENGMHSAKLSAALISQTVEIQEQQQQSLDWQSEVSNLKELLKAQVSTLEDKIQNFESLSALRTDVQCLEKRIHHLEKDTPAAATRQSPVPDAGRIGKKMQYTCIHASTYTCIYACIRVRMKVCEVIFS